MLEGLVKEREQTAEELRKLKSDIVGEVSSLYRFVMDSSHASSYDPCEW